MQGKRLRSSVARRIANMVAGDGRKDGPKPLKLTMDNSVVPENYRVLEEGELCFSGNPLFPEVSVDCP